MNLVSKSHIVATIFSLFALLGMVNSNAGESDKLTVTKSIQLNASPEQVWEVLGDFNGLNNWHPAVANSEQSAWTRVLTLGDGAQITEDMLTYDLNKRSYSYAITASPLPVADYVSSLSVVAEGTGSIVIWSSSFNAANATDEEAKNVVGGVYDAGLGALKERFN